MGRTVDQSGRARSRARKLAMQALYQWQLTSQAPADLCAQFAEDEDYAECDRDYFDSLLTAIVARSAEIDLELAALVDRPLAQLDPVEHAVLMIGLHELRHHPEVPFRVVINEGVILTKRFGATDGHKYVNAILDRAARQLRAAEQSAGAPDGRRN